MERTEALLHLKSGEVSITSGVLRSESPFSKITTWGRHSCWFKSLSSGWLSDWIFWTRKEVEDLERRIKSPLTWILLPNQPGSEVRGRAVTEQFLFLLISSTVSNLITKNGAETSILQHSLKLKRVSGVVIEIF